MKKPSVDQTHLNVQHYYGETLNSSADLLTTACCTSAAPANHVSAALKDIHPEVSARYYGCGLVLPEDLEGLRVLDLGCGAGRDVYLLSRLVGPAGRVVGVDMTTAQLDVARRYQSWHADAYGYKHSNVSFIDGNIEHLSETGLEPESFDLIVSNCVINLAVDKAAVLDGAFRLLVPGGEMYFADIYADRRVPDSLLKHPVLYGECLSGALYWRDFLQLAASSGFPDARVVAREAVAVESSELRALLDGICFDSITCRLFKLAELEHGQEDYGQTATYLGSAAGCPAELGFDEHCRFPAGTAVPISRNTALILRNSRFSRHFEIIDGESRHLGAFEYSPELPPMAINGSGGGSAPCC